MSHQPSQRGHVPPLRSLWKLPGAADTEDGARSSLGNARTRSHSSHSDGDEEIDHLHHSVGRY